MRTSVIKKSIRGQYNVNLRLSSVKARDKGAAEFALVFSEAGRWKEVEELQVQVMETGTGCKLLSDRAKYLSLLKHLQSCKIPLDAIVKSVDWSLLSVSHARPSMIIIVFTRLIC